jgi:hypothetical protein
MTSLIDWDSPDFGKAGQNVHVSSTGSWIEGSHGNEQVDDQ